MTNILVLGGAGYIGSHTCLALSERGYTPVVYDNLCNGHEEFVKWGPFEFGDIRDRRRLDEVLRKHKPAAIVHFAALIEVGESVADPMAFFENNVGGTVTVLAAARDAGVSNLVFSSTCATYGAPTAVPMSEAHGQNPLNPYGRSKLVAEEMLKDLDAFAGFRSVVLRYFNAAGADPEGRIGEWHDPETHAIPIAIGAALGTRTGFTVNGTDYQTRDGTCVRDYVHVVDLASAHVLAVEHLLGGGGSVALNLGTGHGTTLRELVDAIERISGRKIEVKYGGRRQGDAPALVADSSKARELLGWQPKHDLDSIVETALAWHSRELPRTGERPFAFSGEPGSVRDADTGT